jgi:hypothetical protein
MRPQNRKETAQYEPRHMDGQNPHHESPHGEVETEAQRSRSKGGRSAGKRDDNWLSPQCHTATPQSHSETNKRRSRGRISPSRPSVPQLHARGTERVLGRSGCVSLCSLSERQRNGAGLPAAAAVQITPVPASCAHRSFPSTPCCPHRPPLIADSKDEEEERPIDDWKKSPTSTSEEEHSVHRPINLPRRRDQVFRYVGTPP